MQRIPSIDLARGFTVLFIPAIHSVMLYSTYNVHEGVYGKLLAFIAEWPGAQIFMLLMGLCFSLSKTISTKKIITKSLLLLIIGYLMNFLKFVVPTCFGIMPKEFLSDYADGMFSTTDFLLMGDILQFAALALLILLLIHRLPKSLVVSLYLAVLVLLISPLVWDKSSLNPVINHVLRLSFGKPPYTYFPLFPWLVYPLTGFAIGIAIKEAMLTNLWQHLFIVGGFVWLTEFIMQLTPYHFPDTEFYRTYPDTTLMHLGFALLWISFWHFVAQKFSRGKFLSFLTFLSKNITVIYFIQWIIIFWCFHFIGYHKLNLLTSIFISIVISITVFSISSIRFSYLRRQIS